MRTQQRSYIAYTLAETIGDAAATRLLRAYGGRRLYVPRDPPRDHPIALTIGADAARRLADDWGGQRIELPDSSVAELHLRNSRIIREYQRGHPVRTLARAYRLSPRMVRKILDRAGIPRRGSATGTGPP